MKTETELELEMEILYRDRIEERNKKHLLFLNKYITRVVPLRQYKNRSYNLSEGVKYKFPIQVPLLNCMRFLTETRGKPYLLCFKLFSSYPYWGFTYKEIISMASLIDSISIEEATMLIDTIIYYVSSSLSLQAAVIRSVDELRLPVISKVSFSFLMSAVTNSPFQKEYGDLISRVCETFNELNLPSTPISHAISQELLRS